MRGILTYHSIDDSRSPISISADAFRAHVAWLASSDVEVLPLAELVAAPDERDAVAVTFDDGFANLAELGWPLLRDAGVPATLFVATGRVGATNAWGGVDEDGIPTLPLCDWTALGAMAEEGLELGSHSRTHAKLTRVDDAALADELAGAADDLEARTGRRPTAVCYPYGDVDERVTSAARAHYALGCTTEFRPLGAAPDPLALPRLDAYYWRDRPGLEGWGSGAFRGSVWLRGRARDVRARLRGE